MLRWPECGCVAGSLVCWVLCEDRSLHQVAVLPDQGILVIVVPERRFWERCCVVGSVGPLLQVPVPHSGGRRWSCRSVGPIGPQGPVERGGGVGCMEPEVGDAFSIHGGSVLEPGCM